jgi:hypothetical protein
MGIICGKPNLGNFSRPADAAQHTSAENLKICLS